MNRTEILKRIEYWYKKYEIIDDELEKVKRKIVDLDLEVLRVIQNIEALKQKLEPMVFDNEESFEEILNP